MSITSYNNFGTCTKTDVSPVLQHRRRNPCDFN